MKVTEQAIREAMKLAPGVAVTLGTLDEALRTRIAIVGSGLYTVTQSDLGGLKVTMTLQFAAHHPAIVGYPSTVEFYLADTTKLRKMQEGVSEFVAHLQATGQHDEAAKVAALLTLPAEDVERIYDALTSGLSKAEFIEKIEAETGANISKGFAPVQPTEAA